MPECNNCKMNFCLYRLPDMPANTIVGFGSDITLSEVEGEGFLIRKFYPGSPLIFIPSCFPVSMDEAEGYIEHISDVNPDFPLHSTPENKYLTEVETMIQAEKMTPAQIEKGVAARCIMMNRAVDISATFKKLNQLYPHAFVFMFYTPESGIWMGASPECLIRKRGHNVSSDVLAGTKFNEMEMWSRKNIEEHDIVARYILATYRSFCQDSELTEKSTVNAGPVWHLRSRVSGKIMDDKVFFDLARALSPTPALCGYPVDSALKMINTLEDFKREFYGGFCGPCNQENADLYVNLRSGWFRTSQFSLYTGGGIMEDSIPTEEWDETEKKANTMHNALVFKYEDKNTNNNQI